MATGRRLEVPLRISYSQRMFEVSSTESQMANFDELITRLHADCPTVIHAVLLLPMVVLGQVFLISGNDLLDGLWGAGRSLSDETTPTRTDTSEIEAHR